ncbi:hypothetical protein RND81_04G017700 [Saponaria officinalis]|uniref:rRNA N-glycosylase n=1 Tax=Saponaria officinalis TaxID=3572 RepID=A0AAW1LCH5_SAPOF
MKIDVVATIAWILLWSSAWTANAITFDLDEYDGKVYSNFLEQIRSNVEDPRLTYGVNRKAHDAKNEARFLLLAIQVVTEAARFKYIEGLVRKKYPDDSASNDKVIQFEKNWSAISKAVYENAKNGVFTKDYNFGFGKVRQVKDLQMGLFMNVGIAKSSIESDVTDHGIDVI